MTQHEKDIQAIKEFCIGTEFDRKKGLGYKFDEHVRLTDDRMSKIENRLSNIEKANAKRITFSKVLKKIASVFITAKTGI